MYWKIFIILAGSACGVLLAYILITKFNIIQQKPSAMSVSRPGIDEKSQSSESLKKVIGFLPFWLIDNASEDYSPYITQLSYFNLTLDEDGTIQKFSSPGEAEPGWHALFSGKVDNYLLNAKNKGVGLSLTVFSGNDNKIKRFLENPQFSAQNLISEITPVINQYGFSDLNLDIEMVGDATGEQRNSFVVFVSEMRRLLDKNITITVDASPIAFVKNMNLVNPAKISEHVDYIVLMDYDFHNIGSFVTGPVSPQGGAGVKNEFDTESAIQLASTIVPAEKLIMAIPLYGYSWETINNNPRSAVMPGSGFSISNKKVEEFLAGCATCSANFDETDDEKYFIYKNTDSGLYHQVFYPDSTSTQVKVDFAENMHLGGLALWALGYEGNTILEPLVGYRR